MNKLTLQEINAKNNIGDTPLHVSVCRDYQEISDVLPRFVGKTRPKIPADAKNELVAQHDYVLNGHAHGVNGKVSTTEYFENGNAMLLKFGYSVEPSADCLFYSACYNINIQSNLRVDSSTKTDSGLQFSSNTVSKFSFSRERTGNAGDLETINSLLKGGADVNAKNELGFTPGDIVSIYCPDFLNTYHQLVEASGQKDHDFDEL